MFQKISGGPGGMRSRNSRRVFVLVLPFLTMVAFAAGSRVLDAPAPPSPIPAPLLAPNADAAWIMREIGARRKAATAARDAGDLDRALALCRQVSALEACLPGKRDKPFPAPRYLQILRNTVVRGAPRPLQPTSLLPTPE